MPIRLGKILFAIPALIWVCALAGCQSFKDKSNASDAELSVDAILGRGAMDVLDRNSVYMLAAPHGGFDVGTEKVAFAFCERVAWDCVIANGYRTRQRTINVNRPSEGARLAASKEARTQPAQVIYQHFRSQVMAVKGKQLELYVELHNNPRAVTKKNLEVATFGIDAKRARHIKAILEAELQAARLSEISTLIEPIDRITMKASANKRFGIISELSVPSLHLEFPSALFESRLDAVTTMLVAALPRIAASLDG